MKLRAGINVGTLVHVIHITLVFPWLPYGNITNITIPVVFYHNEKNMSADW